MVGDRRKRAASVSRVLRLWLIRGGAGKDSSYSQLGQEVVDLEREVGKDADRDDILYDVQGRSDCRSLEAVRSIDCQVLRCFRCAKYCAIYRGPCDGLFTPAQEGGFDEAYSRDSIEQLLDGVVGHNEPEQRISECYKGSGGARKITHF